MKHTDTHEITLNVPSTRNDDIAVRLDTVKLKISDLMEVTDWGTLRHRSTGDDSPAWLGLLLSPALALSRASA